jgi:hypothetical protein
VPRRDHLIGAADPQGPETVVESAVHIKREAVAEAKDPRRFGRSARQASRALDGGRVDRGPGLSGLDDMAAQSAVALRDQPCESKVRAADPDLGVGRCTRD